MLRIIEQIETRVREMENVVMTTAFVPAEHPLIAANQLALSNYAKAVKGRRGQHTAGSPHLHVAAAVFGAIHAHGVPEASICLNSMFTSLSATLSRTGFVARQCGHHGA